MSRRQTVPRRWLIVTPGEEKLEQLVREVPAGTGVLLVFRPSASAMRRLRQLAGQRRLTLVQEQPRAAARVHDARELRRAMLRRTELILLSPLYPTRSHPDWLPIPRMRAAALARLGGRRLVALGGMNERRYAKIAPLGFIAWAGISAFRT